MFGFFKRSPKRKPTPKPKAKTKLGLESLESRYAPAGDLIAGAALYNGTTPSVVFSFQAKQYSGTFDVGLYQSANKTFEAANDKLIASGKASVSPTNPQGGTVSLSSPIIDDPNLPYLLVVLDPANKIGEAAGTRGNNTTVFTAPGTKGTYQGQTFVVYSGEVRLGGDRNWRNNNPGNLEYGDFAKAHGAIGTDGRFAIFSNETMGTNAVVALLKTSSYQSLTIRQAMLKYAPPAENDTEAYIKFIEKRTGLKSSQKMKTLSDAQLASLVGAIRDYEGGHAGTVYKNVSSSPSWARALLGGP